MSPCTCAHRPAPSLHPPRPPPFPLAPQDLLLYCNAIGYGNITALANDPTIIQEGWMEVGKGSCGEGPGLGCREGRLDMGGSWSGEETSF